MKNYDSPNFPIARPGTPALQKMNEALDRQEAHEQWHEDNPGQWPCPTELSSPADYADIERGECVRHFGGGGTIEPGEAFVFGKGK